MTSKCAKCFIDIKTKSWPEKSNTVLHEWKLVAQFQLTSSGSISRSRLIFDYMYKHTLSWWESDSFHIILFYL